MTAEQAEDLVMDFVQSVIDWERKGSKYYRAEYHEMKQKVIDALTTSEVPSQNGATHD